jgi:hypothetical protein
MRGRNKKGPLRTLFIGPGGTIIKTLCDFLLFDCLDVGLRILQLLNDLI